ncbi:MAG: hypothetical protein ACOC2W_01765 [bacterium]
MLKKGILIYLLIFLINILLVNAMSFKFEDIPKINIEEDQIPPLYIEDFCDYITNSQEGCQNMSFKILSQSNPELINFKIYDKHYLSFNSPKLNSNGTSQIEINATDSDGYDTRIKTIDIEVLPINDKPKVLSKNIEIENDADYYEFDISEIVSDVDNDISELDITIVKDTESSLTFSDCSVDNQKIECDFDETELNYTKYEVAVEDIDGLIGIGFFIVYKKLPPDKAFWKKCVNY